MKPNYLIRVAPLACMVMLNTAMGAEEHFEAKVYASSGEASLNYRIHLPGKMDNSKSYPLVLFFHGAGERGSDNLKQLVHGAKDILGYLKENDEPAIIVAPQCPAGEKWVNTPWGADSHIMPDKPSASMRLVVELLREVRKTYPVDASRIYVTGLSMGGYATWDIIQRMPETFAAAMPVCGGGDTALAETIRNIPIWVFHGGADTVVKAQRSRDMVAALERVGGKVRYTEYEGVGHNSWDRAYRDDEALSWLFGQTRSGQSGKAETN
ncbi:phospholipase [Coraliomargarita sinensis]|uniref:Phospholipase n=1 Tax=Coraliomargarita sinensis TaxID=2174842 RepID=A0A317ZCX0_9BACT|nr:prolyl oligopeptidase family serine peptidase [Coraliomargarita sinensis]PXA03055.1 phospholipase [Coraliomargarita sinensis]